MLDRTANRCASCRKTAGRTLTFKIPMDDVRALTVMKEVVWGRPADRQPFMDYRVYRADEQDVPRGSIVNKYRWSKKWKTFGPGKMEGIEYKVQKMGVRSRRSEVRYQGYYVVTGNRGQWEVDVSGGVSFPKPWGEVSEGELRDAIEDQIQWQLDDMERDGEAPWLAP